MSRYNIEHNGKWACFSSVSDTFITKFMEKNVYEEWRKIEYGLLNYKPAEECNTMGMTEAVFSIRLNRTRDEGIKCLLETGLLKEECEQLMYNMETIYFVPKLLENGTYICPNCKTVVKKGQKRCEEQGCEHELCWREQVK